MERPQDKLETAGSAPKKRLIKNKPWVKYTMERPQYKLETAGIAPKMKLIKNKTWVN